MMSTGESETVWPEKEKSKPAMDKFRLVIR